MGPKPALLLVSRRSYYSLLCMIIGLFLLQACGGAHEKQRVNANDYDSFWLWAGVKPQPILDRAKTIYIMEGEIRAAENPRLTSLRPATPDISHAAIWMVVRVETLDWPPSLQPQILSKLAQWKAKGNRVAGLQIDFDARTQRLDEYASFLRNLRADLPKQYKLSITGLLDWSANGDPVALKALSDIVDDIVLQVYQGRHTIPGYEAYFTRIKTIGMPYRIGLVQNGDWDPPEILARDPNFRGYVVFLLNPE
jgi:hypothetical protein